jgi:hypothetical protein
VSTVLPECPRDGKPIPDGGFICRDCGDTLRVALEHILNLRDELEATITRQARTRSTGGRRPDAQPEAARVEPAPRSRFMEPPISNEGASPFNVAASEAAGLIDNTVTTWARHLMESVGVDLPEAGPSPLGWFPLTITHPRCPVVPHHPTARAALLMWRHVHWWRQRAEVEEMLEEILSAEKTLMRAIDTDTRSSMYVGPCPILWPDEDDQMRTCGGEVRAWPMPAVDTLRDLQRTPVRMPKCLRCETEADITWWHREMMPDLAPQVTTDGLISVIAFELHWTVTHEQIRQWKHRGRIHAHPERDSRGRTLWDHGAVIAAIREDVETQRAKAATA